MADLATDVRAALRDVPDFPKPGILFKDITPIMQDPALFRRVAEWMAAQYDGRYKVVAVESRGFLFGAAMSQHAGSSLVLARKKGKLPYATTQVEYELEYGTATLEMHVDAVSPGDQCVIVDDLLATGGTAGAAAELVRRQGGTVVGALFLVELGFLDGRRRLHPMNVTSLLQV